MDFESDFGQGHQSHQFWAMVVSYNWICNRKNPRLESSLSIKLLNNIFGLFKNNYGQKRMVQTKGPCVCIALTNAVSGRQSVQ